MKYLITLSAAIGVILLYLLSRASANTSLFVHNYNALLILAVILAISLMVLVAYQIWQVISRLKKGIYGAKLTWRLARFFGAIAVLPGFVVYAVSVQFLDKSIESWFDVRVEKALEGGLNLGRSSLQSGLEELKKKGQFVSLILGEQTERLHNLTLARVVEQGGVQEVAVVSKEGMLLAASGLEESKWPELPNKEELRQVRKQGSYSLVDIDLKGNLVLRVIVPIKSKLADEKGRYLQLKQAIPKQWAKDAENVQAVYRDYQELSLSRLGLKKLYGITLTLSLLIVLLSALSAAIFLSSKLSAPLAALAEGTQAVAQGNLSGNYPVQSNDELGALTGLFNQMIRQLATAKQQGEQQQQKAEEAKSHLERVLSSLSSGVIVIDGARRLKSVNTSAEKILDTPLQNHLNELMSEIAETHPLLRTFFGQLAKEIAAKNEGTWQRQLERMSKKGEQNLLVRGTEITESINSDQVIVFDDITHLLQTERQAAWGEVARRLAHEIKNPLTPIQLSAERLQHKLKSKLEETDAKFLTRAIATIVSQVGAMKSMVTEFANYARIPAVKLQPLDIHELLNEVLGLYEANTSPIKLEMTASKTRVNGDPTRIRQVIHNLLQNAHDALQHQEHPEIVVKTENADPDLVRVWVNDNGTGFPENLLARAFEPYMTTKTKGTGLGLAIVKKIIEEHNGNIRIENLQDGGTSICFEIPTVKSGQI